MAGLRDRVSPGWPEWLSKGEQATLRAIILKGPDRERHGCVEWTLPALCEEIATRFAKTLHPASLEPDVQAVLVLDQAGWHSSRALDAPDNVTLVPLPPYSPQLTPVERVWLYLRDRVLSHRLLDSYEDIANACCDAWRSDRFSRTTALLDQLPVARMCHSLGSLI